MTMTKPKPDQLAEASAAETKLTFLAERHRIEPVEVEGDEKLPLASVDGVLTRHVCGHDGIPVYAVGGGQWRHDASAIRNLRAGVPVGPARMSL